MYPGLFPINGAKLPVSPNVLGAKTFAKVSLMRCHKANCVDTYT